jgi:hypothetical protein
MMARIDSRHWAISTGHHFQNGRHNVAAILKMATGRNFSMSAINSGHHYLPTNQIFMISGNVEFLPPIFYTVFWQPFWKWQTSRNASHNTAQIQHCPISTTFHVGRLWCPEMIPDIKKFLPVSIFKMATWTVIFIIIYIISIIPYQNVVVKTNNNKIWL